MPVLLWPALALEVIGVGRPAHAIEVVTPASQAAVPPVHVVDSVVVRVLAVRLVFLDAARLVSKEGSLEASRSLYETNAAFGI